MSTPAATDALDRESNLLPQDPPPWFVQSLAWLIIVLCATTVVVAVTVNFPETVSCPAQVVPEGGADPIQSPRAAVVREVLVHEGSAVTKGDRLFVLSSEDTSDRSVLSRSLAEDLATRQADLKRAARTDEADLQIKDHEIAQADEEVKFREATLAVERDLAGRVRKLAAQGIYSETDVIRRDLEVTEAEKDLAVMQRTRAQLALQRQQLSAEQERIRSDSQADVRKLEVRLQALQEQLNNSDQNLITIRAPYDAVVVSTAANNPGSVLQMGQELCQLAPNAGRLDLRLILSEKGMSRLAVGQPVRFFVEAFPYQRYGTLAGTLTWISPSAVSSRDAQQFVALAALGSNEFQVAGHARPLRVGMRGEARVLVGRRTLIEYVLEPLRQLRENLGR